MWHTWENRREILSVSWVENVKERDHLEGLGLVTSIMSKWIFKGIGQEVMDWSHLAGIRGKWETPVSEVISLWVPFLDT
jgi:hypothetical protein